MSLKKQPNIYQGYEFTNVPYDTNEKFSVYIPKEKDSYMESLARSHRDNNPSSRFPPSRSLPKYLEPLNEPYEKEEAERSVHFPDINNRRKTPPQNEEKNGEIFKIEENEYQKLASLSKKEQPRRSKSLDGNQNNRSPQQSVSPQLSSGKKKHPIESLQQIKTLEAFRAKLYFDERTKTVPKSTIKSNIIENLIKEKDNVMTNKELVRSILKLKSLNLLKNPTLRIEHLKGGKVGFVTNDYHLRETNPGYVRNTLGTFFTR